MILLSTMMIPWDVTMIPLYMEFNLFGWINTLKPLIVPSFFGSGFFIFMLRQFLLGIPKELDEAARIDGANAFQIYWRIYLPLMKPALILVAIFNILNTWNDYLGPLIFLNDQSNWPAASRIGNATGATTARDTLGDKTFVKRKRMSQEERHLQILQAAVKIIATKGFWGMSLQNISDELGITEAALYHYISSKDDLLNMVLSECYDTIDADEYNAVTAAIVDADGHRVYYYPRYCLNIVLYNLQRPELVQLYSVLNGEALNPSHPAHDFFIGRHLRQWEMICSMNWLLPPDVDEERFYDLYTLAMSAMDGLQYRWLGDNSMNLLEQWMSISDIIFPDSEWQGFRDPSEHDPKNESCLLPLTLSARQ